MLGFIYRLIQKMSDEGEATMTYTTQVEVPYMNESMIAELVEIVPGLGYMNIPVIETQEAAIREATTMLQPKLDRDSQTEHISGVQTVTLDTLKNLWTVTFKISGD